MGDGGIYILHTPTDSLKGMEYRVMHLYDIKVIWGTLPNGHTDYDLISGEKLNEMFGRTKVYTDLEDARECANKLYYRLEMSDPALVSDGINAVHLSEPFHYYLAISGIKPVGTKTKKTKRTKANGKDKKAAKKKDGKGKSR